MNSRMDKYTETPVLKSRSEKNKDLYEQIKTSEIDRFDVNSNATVLGEDVVKIDVDKVRDMLDKRYRDEYNKRTLIVDNSDEETNIDKTVDTKEYDINAILEQAKEKQTIDYEKERLKKVHDTQYDILKSLNVNGNEEVMEDSEENIMNLINTITELELRNKENKKSDNTALDLLSELSDNDTTSVYKTMELDKDEITSDVETIKTDNSYEDFKDLENDLKSNNIAIKIVGVVFGIILLILLAILINNYFKLGLF